MSEPKVSWGPSAQPSSPAGSEATATQREGGGGKLGPSRAVWLCCAGGRAEGRPTAGAQPASQAPGWRRRKHLESITCSDQSMFKVQTKPQLTQPGWIFSPFQVEQHVWAFHFRSQPFAAAGPQDRRARRGVHEPLASEDTYTRLELPESRPISQKQKSEGTPEMNISIFQF